jgi:hypothetical protein
VEGRYLDREAQQNVRDAETDLHEAEEGGKGGQAREAGLAPREKCAKEECRKKQVPVRSMEQVKALCALKGGKEDPSGTGRPLKAGKARIAGGNEATEHDLKREEDPGCPDPKAKPAARSFRRRVGAPAPRRARRIGDPLLDEKQRRGEEIPDRKVRGHRPGGEEVEHGEPAEHDLKEEKEPCGGAPSRGETACFRGDEACGGKTQKEQRHDGAGDAMPVLEGHPKVELRDERTPTQGPVRTGKARTVGTHQGAEHELPRGERDQGGVGVGEVGEKTRIARRRSLL